MKTMIRVSALLCAAVLLLSGCGTKIVEESTWVDGNGSTQVIKHTSGSSGNDAVSGTEDEYGRTDVNSVISDSKAVNLKGATVTIGHYLKNYCGKPETSSPTYQEEVQLISDIEKKYNCKLEFKYVGASTAYYKAWTTAAQAGTKFADIIQISSAVINPTHIKAGYLAKLDNYIDAKSVIYNQEAMKQMEYNGGHYATIMSNRLYAPTGLFFNKKVFSTFGQKTPDTFVSSNKWNWDTFLELAKATTGSKNNYNYFGYGFESYDATYWAIANGGKKIINKDGKKTFNMGSKEYLKGIQFLYELYNTYKVSPEMTSAEKLWLDGKVAMYLALPGNGTSFMETLGSKNVGFTYIPKGPDVNEYISTVEETTAFAVPSTVTNPEVMAHIMTDFTYPYKWRQTLEEQLESYMGDATSLKTAMDWTVRANKNINLMPSFTYILEVCRSGYGINEQTSPTGYIASVSAAAQAEIDGIWGQ